MASEQVLTQQSRISVKPFDRTTLRVNQAFIIALLVVGFLLNQPVFVVFVAAVMAIGTAFPQAALFQRIYRDLLKPAKVLQPDLHEEDPAPHRFAQGMGLGWALTIIVIALAAVNLVFGFCAGCFVYFQLQRFGLMGK